MNRLSSRQLNRHSGVFPLLLLGAAVLAGCSASGTVPAASMSVAVQNGTTLTVSVVVNDTPVATLKPRDCVGCAGDDGLSASHLPSPPWTIQVRSPSGRVLTMLTVHEGDVVYSTGISKGDANRVDLSCGRIDAWSGPPLAGPAPDPGIPGDCAP